MKNYYLTLSFFLLLGMACRQTPSLQIQTQDLSRIAVTDGRFKVYELDSTRILYPQGIHYFNGHIILVEQKNDPVLSFWNADSLTYEFSAARKGGGPNEVKYVDSDYFNKTDSTFFILDSDVEKEVRVRDHAISVGRQMPILVPDAVNRLVRIDSTRYVMCGLNGGSKEHILYETGGSYQEFGEYPDIPCPPEERSLLFYKFIAHRPGSAVIYDFYLYVNRVRKYDLSGNLLEEIALAGIPERNNSIDKLMEGGIEPYFRMATSCKDFIAVLYYERSTSDQIYSFQVSPELQLWNWEGKLIKRYRFDRNFDKYTISDDGILYAKDSDSPYTVYTYALRTEPVE